MSNPIARGAVPSLWTALALVAALGAAPALEAQNLVTNGGFDTDLADWSPSDGNTVIAWHPMDASGNPGSGSVRFENPALAQPRALSQCINVPAGATLRLAARYRLEGAGFGYATVNALQFLGADCAGSPFFLAGARVDGTVTEQWSPLVSTPTLGVDFRSIRLDLATVGNGRAAQFDEVAVELEAFTPEECVASATVLCLVGDRYRVEASWRTGAGGGPAQAIEIDDGPGSGTGYFWFFAPTNVEVVVKVLDACTPFGRVWVFAGGLTDQEVELRVLDTQTGARWTHLNPLGQVWATVTDTDALDVCD